MIEYTKTYKTLSKRFDDNLKMLNLFIKEMPEIPPILEEGNLFCEALSNCNNCKLNEKDECTSATGYFNHREIQKLKEIFPEYFV